MKADVVEGLVEKGTGKEIVKAMQKIKSGKATESSEVRVEMIVASGELRVKAMMDLCQSGMDPASNFWGGAAEIYFHSRRSISVALSKYVSAVFGILISIHVVNTDVFV